MQAFFKANFILVSFGHGLVFFLLGLAIAITLRHTPRSSLRLAKSLVYVAAYGVLYGIAEWGTTFIPLQTVYLPEPTLLTLRVLRLLVLVLGFTALGWFGHNLLAPPRGLPAWLQVIPPVAALIWLAGFSVHPLLDRPLDVDRWLYAWEMGARFLMGIPATLIAAYALLEQRAAMVQMGFQAARGYLLGAALALVVVAFTAGLVDPRPMDTTNLLDRDVLFLTTGVPLEVVRASAGLALTVFFVLVMEALAYDTRRQLDEAERRRAILEERHRIGQELQDAVIQRIYAATLYLEAAAALTSEEKCQTQDSLRAALASLGDTIVYIREHVVDSGGLPIHMGRSGPGVEANDTAPLEQRRAEVVQLSRPRRSGQTAGGDRRGLHSDPDRR